MVSRNQKSLRIIGLLVAISIFQVYVLGSTVRPNSSTTGTSATSTRAGKLSTRFNSPVFLNDLSATTGATVMTGAQLLTPEGVGASVQLGTLGVVQIAPATHITLNFNDNNVDVALDFGSAVLTTAKGISGSITTREGKTERTNPATGSTVSAGNSATVGSALPSPANGAGKGLIQTNVAIAIAVAAGAVGFLLGVFVPCHGGNTNPSPSTATNQNNCNRNF